jgi:prepilin-type N-terminal cleavage/methylation domain-containing protein
MSFNLRKLARARRQNAFTMVETMVAVSLIGVGVATVIAALTQINSNAAISRNMTGAYAVLTNQVDLFQSIGPFNPQKTNQDGSAQIPKDSAHGSFPTYDMTVSTTPRSLSVDGTTWNIPVYQYKDASNNIIEVVNGQLTETVTDLSSATPALPNTYEAVFTITYTYRNRSYTYSMSAIRTSDG